MISPMNLANIISASRIILAPVFFVVYFLPSSVISPKIIVVILIPLFIFMQFTDFLDGYVARKYKIVSDFGKLFDPFCDVLANLVVLFCFTQEGYILSPFFLLVVYREFSIVFVRLLAIHKGIVIGAKMLGKIKTVLYISVGGVCLAIKTAEAFSFSHQTVNFLSYFNIITYSLAAIFSILSFLSYLRDYKNIDKV